MAIFLPHVAASQQDTLWYGHVAFAEGRYDEAITAYQAAIDQGETWDWLPELIQTVQVRKDLGTISPVDTHRIGMIFVTTLNEVTGTDTVSSVDVTQTQKNTWRVYFGVFRQTLESFSGGNWTVAIDTVDAISTFKAGASLSRDNPDHLNLEEYFFEHMSGFDSFISFSNTRSPALGLARRYPYIQGVLYGPHRGMAQINAGTHGYGVLLHEFFHIVEWAGNINPPHGYYPENRHHFPGWTDTTEFSYYRWHFSATLPNVGWQRLNHRTRWIPFENRRTNFESLQSLYSAVSLENRLRADTLAKEGNALMGSDSAAAKAKWEEAVSLSPHHEEALIRLREHHEFILRDSEAARDAFDRLKVNRSVNDFVTIDTANKDFGSVVGLWYREDIGHNTQFIATWKFKSWDLTKYLSQSGNYVATFYYTTIGFTSLDMDSVSVLENGVQVSFDGHRGMTGRDTASNNSYSISVPNYKPTAIYHLRARIKGGGGIDCYGQIHLRYTGSTTSTGSDSESPSRFRLFQNYPNPFNPGTSFEFQVPSRELVNISLFDLLGREVAVVVNDYKPPGTYAVSWDASRLPSGVYYYRMTAGGFSETKKMMLMR
jgi:hypothetical protein